MWPHSCWTEGNNHFPWPILLMHPRTPLAFHAARAGCWLTGTRVPPSTSAPFLLGCSTMECPSMSWCLGLFLARGYKHQTSPASLSLFPQPAQSPGWQHNALIITFSSQFCVTGRCAEDTLRPIAQFINADDDQHHTQHWPWHTLLVPGLQLDCMPLLAMLWAQLSSQALWQSWLRQGVGTRRPLRSHPT